MPPVSPATGPDYDPFAVDNLADSMARAFEARPGYQFPTNARRVPMFTGTGVYALYYRGPLEIYQPLARANTATLQYPIYVGKAEGGRRQGGASVECPLRERLLSHRRTVSSVADLNPTHFWYRYLNTRSLWVALGEYGLIRRYRPLWNVLLDGFGNNAPGAGRAAQERSRWDTLHPGRPAAAELPDRAERPEQIATLVQRYFVSVGLLESLDLAPLALEAPALPAVAVAVP